MDDYLNSEMSAAIDEVVHNELYRRILKMRLLDGMTYEHIAETVDRSPRQIASIMSRFTGKLYLYLKKRQKSS